jgi:hypothetical protein
MAVVVMSVLLTAVAGSAAPDVQVAPHLQAHMDEIKYPRFMYYCIALYWNKEGRHPEAILAPDETFEELAGLNYNGLKIATYNDWIRSSLRSFTDAYGIDSAEFLRTADAHDFDGLVGTAWPGIARHIVEERPELRCIGLNGKPGQLCINEPEALETMKLRLTELAERYRGIDSVLGLYIDEPAWNGGYCPRCVEYFREYLRENFTAEELAARGINPDTAEPVPPADPIKPAPHEDRFLWHVSRAAANQAMYDYFEALADHWHSVAPDWPFCVNTSWYSSGRFPVTYPLSTMVEIADLQMTDLYWHASPVQAYVWELHNYLHPNVWQIHDLARNDPATIRRDIHFARMHTDGIMTFDYKFLYLHAQKHEKGYWVVDNKAVSYNPDKHADMLAAVREPLAYSAAAEDYLFKAETKSPVGILHCEYDQTNGFCGRYTTEDMEVFGLFRRNQIPVRALYLDTLTREDLDDLACLVITSRSVADEHAALLAEWVADGGVLVATNDAVSKCNRYGEERDGLALAEVFGLNDAGEPLADKQIAYRDALVEGAGIEDAGEMAVLRREGVPVALINRHGAGYGVMFFGSSFTFAREYEQAEAAGTGIWLDLMERSFDDGAWLDTWQMVVTWAVSMGSHPMPLTFPAGCPGGVQVNYREQDLGDELRRVVHLLNRGEEPVADITVSVRVPVESSVDRVLEIGTGVPVAYERRGEAVVFVTPRFEEYLGVAVVSPK